ncbi:MAG: LysE family transporter [Dehalococcoidales bacterium]|nr:LysE family transporter [Dehalococcoidales bacterium]
MVPFLSSVAVISLSGVMMPGPMFAVTVARSYHSPLAGLKMALGHAIVEVPLALLIYFGLARFFDREPVQVVLYLVGGSLLVWMGVSMFRKRGRSIDESREMKYNSVVAGVVTSIANPFFILWWVAVGSMLVMKSLSFGVTGFILLITVHLACDFGWLFFVSTVVYRTRAMWREKFRVGMLIACSLLLIGFGGWFLSSGVRLLV